ncbi:MAG: hypothetical protein R3310_03850 [Candidatus Competibacteraceae bacterium]|nr:hypothetical protein [Candidatus Competibacteraceae bacterium]
MKAHNFRRRALGALLALGATLSTLPALADIIEGRINGLKCATEGIVCPIDKLDPMVAAERDFVVQLPDGSFYFITNLDRAVKARYVLDNVRVSGDLNERYRAIEADELMVKRDGEYRTVWSPEREARVWNELRRPGATRP